MDGRKRKRREEGVDARRFIGVLAVVALGETPNHDPILAIKFRGLNRLFGWGLVGAITEINFVHVLKSHQTEQSLLNKFWI
jgi:hypothetical protein